MDFEKERAADDWFDCDHCGIEAFDVADLQDAREFFGGGEKSVRFGESARHRLFDKNVESEFHQAAAHVGMVDRWDGDACGVHFPAQIFERTECFRLEFPSNLYRAFGILVVDSDEIGTGKFAIYTRVVAAELAGANDGHTYPVVISGHCTHCFFIPPDTVPSSAAKRSKAERVAEVYPAPLAVAAAKGTA